MLTLGKIYPPYGKLASIRSINGERYYFFIDKQCVSMMPACVVEKEFHESTP